VGDAREVGAGQDACDATTCMCALEMFAFGDRRRGQMYVLSYKRAHQLVDQLSSAVRSTCMRTESEGRLAWPKERSSRSASRLGPPTGLATVPEERAASVTSRRASLRDGTFTKLLRKGGTRKAIV
jgi:hypothetical protein